MATRAQQQATTRSAIIAAATELFLHDGYHAVSLDAVAARAGFTKGAVYSNFDGKPWLALEVVDAVRQDRLGRLLAGVSSAPSWDEALDAVADWERDTVGDRGWTLLEVEFTIAVVGEAELQRAVTQRQTGILLSLSRLLATQAERHGLTLLLPPTRLAEVVVGLGVGLGLQRSLLAGESGVLTDTIRALTG